MADLYNYKSQLQKFTTESKRSTNQYPAPSITRTTTDIQNNHINIISNNNNSNSNISKKPKKTKKEEEEEEKNFFIEEKIQGAQTTPAIPTVNVHSIRQVKVVVPPPAAISVGESKNPRRPAVAATIAATVTARKRVVCDRSTGQSIPTISNDKDTSSETQHQKLQEQLDQVKVINKTVINPKSKLDEQKNQQQEAKEREQRPRRKTIDTKDNEDEKTNKENTRHFTRLDSKFQLLNGESESRKKLSNTGPNQSIIQKIGVQCKKPENNLIKENPSKESILVERLKRVEEPKKTQVIAKKPQAAQQQQRATKPALPSLPLAIIYPRPEAVQRAAEQAAAKAKAAEAAKAAKAAKAAEAAKAAAAQPVKVLQAIFYPPGRPTTPPPKPQSPPKTLPIAISFSADKLGFPGVAPPNGVPTSDHQDTKNDIPLAIYYTSEEAVRQAASQRADVEHQTKVQELAAAQFRARQAAATQNSFGLPPFNQQYSRGAYFGKHSQHDYLEKIRAQAAEEGTVAFTTISSNKTTSRSHSIYPLTGGLMQNDMVSIPAANMNGGLKAASSNAGAGTGGVSSSVLANAPRVYLTSASTFMANRQPMAVTGGTASVVGKVPLPNMVSNFSSTATAATGAATATTTGAAAGTAVRYFSQFSKPAAATTMNGATVPMPMSMPMKFLNGDTIVLANGNKPMIFTTATAAATAAAAAAAEKAATGAGTGTGTTVLNGANNRFLLTKMDTVETAAPAPTTTATTATAGGGGGGGGAGATVIKEEQQNQALELTTGKATEDTDAEPELDIVINNVVCSFSVRCHLKLRDIALHGANVEYRRENGMVTMKLRHPYTTASIWSSGRITCTGATSEIMAKVAARRYARCLGKLGFPTRFQNFRIVNVLGTCSMPWAIKIVNFSERHRENASYEPELHPGVTYKMRDPKATLKIFSTGSITVTAASVNDVEAAIQHIYPLAYEFRKQRSPEEMQHMRAKQKQYNNNSADPTEVEEVIANQAKVAAKNDIFVNTTAAHTNSSASAVGDGSLLASTSINNMQRLKQFESYRQMANQTQDERRHVPFTTAPNNPPSNATASAAASSSSSSSSTSTGDNICANARRRATECWATKLQNKRPRYNDPGSTDTANAGTLARKFGNVVAPAAGGGAGGGGVNSGGVKPQQQALKAPLQGGHTITKLQSTTIAATATSAMGTLRSINSSAIITASSNSNKSSSCSTIPVDVFIKQENSSRVRNVVQANHKQQLQQLQQQQLEREQSFSPSDFHVDDLIEEDDEMEMGMMQY